MQPCAELSICKTDKNLCKMPLYEVDNNVWENNSKRIKNTCGSGSWHLYLSKQSISYSFKAYVKIINKDASDSNSWKIVLGVSSLNDSNRCTWVGNNENSSGYIANGYKAQATSSGMSYGESYDTDNEIIIERTKSNQLVFYKNGICQGTAFEGIAGSIYLAVSLSHPNHEVELQKVIFT